MLRPFALATLIAGTLDISMAAAITLLRGRDVPGMLRFVAAGPFPLATSWGTAGALLGLVVHFALMAVMVGVFLLAARRYPHLRQRWIAAGLAYGLLTYVVLDLIVVPLRFPSAWPPTLLSISTQLFAHLGLVGLISAYVARRYLAAPRP